MTKDDDIRSIKILVTLPAQRASDLFEEATAGMDPEAIHRLRYDSTAYRNIVRTEIRRRICNG